MSQEHLANTVHGAAAHAGAGHEAHHELANFISFLKQGFPEAGWVEFLHHWENVVFAGLALGIICFVSLRAASKKSLVPDGVQNFCEFVAEGIEGFVTGILGERGIKHIPYLGTVFIYILLMNWMGLVPFMKSPTSVWSTTFALAICTMVYVQVTGIREQGLVHYLKHIAGNPSNLFGLVLIPLMLVLNLTIEFVAVPVSLSLRLFANISSEDRLLFNFAGLGVNSPFHVGILFQLFANMLSIVFSIIQAFVFMLLSTVYISLVLPHDDHHGHEEHAAAHAH